MSTLHLVTAPAAFVTAADVKAYLRISGGSEDTAIAQMIAAVVSEIDGRDGWLGRALGQQTWDLKLRCFARCIALPLPPLQSVTSITYRDINGDQQTLSSDQYEVFGKDTSKHGWIEPKQGVSWPSTYSSAESVTVRFVAGYETVPAAIKEAVIKKVIAARGNSGAGLEVKRESVEGVGTTEFATSAEALRTLADAADDQLMAFRVFD